mmetsp:Transcript_65931/g.109987  ORF Transcript_65931/g.109987 Transcript_65931/m.109987 type:complete len:233 (-) Transcript_65931:202-900(-)
MPGHGLSVALAPNTGLPSGVSHATASSAPLLASSSPPSPLPLPPPLHGGGLPQPPDSALTPFRRAKPSDRGPPVLSRAARARSTRAPVLHSCSSAGSAPPSRCVATPSANCSPASAPRPAGDGRCGAAAAAGGSGGCRRNTDFTGCCGVGRLVVGGGWYKGCSSCRPGSWQVVLTVTESWRRAVTALRRGYSPVTWAAQNAACRCGRTGTGSTDGAGAGAPVSALRSTPMPS